LGLAAAAVLIAAGVAFFVLKPGSDDSSANAARNSQRRGASGTLAKVKDSSLTIRMADGTSVKVSTSKSTIVTKALPGSFADIKVGDNVVVTGVPTGAAAITAERVVDNGNQPGGQGPFGGPPRGEPGMPPGMRGRPPFPGDPAGGGGFAAGAVQSVTGSNFVVTVWDGTPITVSLGPGAEVSVVRAVQLKELTVGQQTVASGKSNSDGTLVATSVQQGVAGVGPGPGRRDPRIPPP